MRTPPAEVVPYDPAWPAAFQTITRHVAAAVPQAAVEHVGGTAVPGLAAKPVVDVDVPAREACDAPHRDHTLPRDYPRAHPAEAARYAARKRGLARLLRTEELPA